MAMHDTPPPERRDKARPVKVYLTPSERAQIEKTAAVTGLPLGVFLRNVALGAKVTSVLDLEAMLALLRINGRLVRLGRLLKLSLSNERDGPQGAELTRLVQEIEDAQEALLALINQLWAHRNKAARLRP
jgi:hypothetical protein